MTKFIDPYLPRMRQLCRQHRVLSLWVFGSVLTDRFNADSDVDLLVRFEKADHEKWDYVDNYFSLLDNFEGLLGRKVDLLEEGGLRNKVFISNLNRTRRLIYG